MVVTALNKIETASNVGRCIRASVLHCVSTRSVDRLRPSGKRRRELSLRQSLETSCGPGLRAGLAAELFTNPNTFRSAWLSGGQ